MWNEKSLLIRSSASISNLINKVQMCSIAIPLETYVRLT